MQEWIYKCKPVMDYLQDVFFFLKNIYIIAYNQVFSIS